MLPFGVTIPATVPQGSEIPEELMNNPVYILKSCLLYFSTHLAVDFCELLKKLLKELFKILLCTKPRIILVPKYVLLLLLLKLKYCPTTAKYATSEEILVCSD
jgi:hypothetical protein